jgi:DNA-binding CsgD family transcriptional regulator
VQEAVTTLRSGGGAAPRLHTHGVAALTPAQRRVAELAASGCGNREIADELNVSQKTVETHLRRVFSKLDIKSRHQLASRLRGGPR